MCECLSVLVGKENGMPAQLSNFGFARFPDAPSSLHTGIILETEVPNNTVKALGP
jgi:hypothetical protein